jgi:hypothetical protein
MNNYQPAINVGDFLSRPKALGLINHFGLVIARDRVLQNTPEKGEHVTTMQEFASGKPVTVQPTGVHPSLVSSRAREILDNPQKYSLFNRNCEHTAHDAAYGKAKSPMLFWVAVGAVAGVLIWICCRRN